MHRRAGVALALVVVLAGCLGSGATPATDGSPTTTPGPDATTTTVTTAGPGEYVVTVERVVDGDTVRVRYRNGTEETVRLLGVDTPETYDENDPAEYEGVPDTADGVACLDAFGANATAFAREHLADRTVRVRVDPAADHRDRFGRLLAYVLVNETNVGYALVAEGHARVYDAPFSESDRYYEAEARAQDARLGLWRCRAAGGTTTGSPTATDGGAGDGGASDGDRGDAAGLVVARIHEDAAGNDHENPNDEYVVFENVGDEPLDLSGWTVADEANHTYRFPAGFVLDPGERVTLYTGSGTDTATELYWRSERAVWNNGGDTVVVRRPDGTVVLAERYD